MAPAEVVLRAAASPTPQFGRGPQCGAGAARKALPPPPRAAPPAAAGAPRLLARAATEPPRAPSPRADARKEPPPESPLAPPPRRPPTPQGPAPAPGCPPPARQPAARRRAAARSAEPAPEPAPEPGASGAAAASCSKCRGRGWRGAFGPRGLGVIRRPCRHCSEGLLAEAPPAQGGEGGSVTAPDFHDRVTTPAALAAGGVVLGVGAAVAVGIAGVPAAACAVGGVAAGFIPTGHALLNTAVRRAVGALLAVRTKLKSLPRAERWHADLSAYLQVTSATLEHISTMPVEGSTTTLLDCLSEINGVLEKLSNLLTKFADRRRLAKALDQESFHSKRQELMDSLSLWNSSMTHALQALHQDTLTKVLAEVRALAAQSKH